jgi:EAL domain-containing protein (putative c-di-GMP-specific phosphodiesterase class I)
MARNLGFSVTAEGVETLEQADALKQMACDTLQGYYFSRPVPAADIPALLSRKWLTDGPSTCLLDPADAAASG